MKMQTLTPAEKRYLGLLAGGLTVEEISSRLKIGRQGLHVAFYKIRKKTGMDNNTQLVIAYLTQNTITKKGA